MRRHVLYANTIKSAPSWHSLLMFALGLLGGTGGSWSGHSTGQKLIPATSQPSSPELRPDWFAPNCPYGGTQLADRPKCFPTATPMVQPHYCHGFPAARSLAPALSPIVHPTPQTIHENYLYFILLETGVWELIMGLMAHLVYL